MGAVYDYMTRPSGFRTDAAGNVTTTWADSINLSLPADDFHHGVMLFEGIAGQEQIAGDAIATEYIRQLKEIRNTLAKLSELERTAYAENRSYYDVNRARESFQYIQLMNVLAFQYAAIQNLLNDSNNHDTLQKDPDISHNRKQLKNIRRQLYSQTHYGDGTEENYFLPWLRKKLFSEHYLKGKDKLFSATGVGSDSLWDAFVSHTGMHGRMNSGVPNMIGKDNENKLCMSFYHDNSAPLFYDAGYISAVPLSDKNNKPVDNLTIGEIRALAGQMGLKVTTIKNGIRVKCTDTGSTKQWMDLLRQTSEKKRAAAQGHSAPSLDSGTPGAIPPDPTAPPPTAGAGDPATAAGDPRYETPRYEPPPPPAPAAAAPAAPPPGMGPGF